MADKKNVTQNHFGKTALMYAIQYNQLESMKLLLDEGADVNLATFIVKKAYGCDGYDLKAGKRSPLMYAAWYASPETVELLIARGADKLLKDTNDHNACDYIDKNEDVSEMDKEKLEQLLCI